VGLLVAGAVLSVLGGMFGEWWRMQRAGRAAAQLIRIKLAGNAKRLGEWEGMKRAHEASVRRNNEPDELLVQRPQPISKAWEAHGGAFVQIAPQEAWEEVVNIYRDEILGVALTSEELFRASYAAAEVAHPPWWGKRIYRRIRPPKPEMPPLPEHWPPDEDEEVGTFDVPGPKA
jgi:hypothetical protein